MRRFRALLSRLLPRFLRDERGQTSTEYMMVIAVLVVAMVGASRPFVSAHGPFQRAMKQLSRNIGSVVASPDSEILPGPSGPDLGPG